MRPRVLTMFWGECDGVMVEVEQEDEMPFTATLTPGDSYSWTVPGRRRRFTISVYDVEVETNE